MWPGPLLQSALSEWSGDGAPVGYRGQALLYCYRLYNGVTIGDTPYNYRGLALEICLQSTEVAAQSRGHSLILAPSWQAISAQYPCRLGAGSVAIGYARAWYRLRAL